MAVFRQSIDCLKASYHGAPVSLSDDIWQRLPALWWAVAIENTAMLPLLLERGASVEDQKMACALQMAEEFNLDSMAEILRGLGAEVTERIPVGSDAPRNQWFTHPNPNG